MTFPIGRASLGGNPGMRMRHRAIIGAIAIAAAGGATLVAHAQQPEIRWERVPAAEDVARHYPPEAIERSVSGAAILCCYPHADGSLSCLVAHEAPSGMGFGNAGLHLAAKLRLSEADAAAWIASTRPIHVPMPFRIAGGSGTVEETLRATETICETPRS